MIKKLTRGICIGAIFLIPIFPLIVANSYFFPFITGKAFYFRVLVEIAFASWIILAFLEPQARPKVTKLSVAVGLFTVIALIADLLGVNPLRSLWSNFERMEGWITIIHLFAFYIVTTSVFGDGEEGRRWWHRWFNVSILSALAVSVYGISQLLGLFEIHQGTRVDASLGNAAYMAVYMLLNAGLSAYLFYVELRKKRGSKGLGIMSWAYGISFIIFSVLLFETATRGTALGWIGAVILSCGIYAIFGKNEPVKWRKISAGVIGLVVLVGVIFWLNRGSSFVQHNDVLTRLASISWSDTTSQARQYIWPMAITGALHRPIFGWGQENFNYIFNSDYDPKMWSQEQWFDRAHNVFLDWLVASGFVGLLAYLSLYVLFLIVVWKSTLTMAEKSVLTGLLAGYFFHNIFVFDNLASYVLFFAALGFVNSLDEESSKQWLGSSPICQDAVEYIVAPIVIVALIGVIYYFDVRPIQANTSLITALQSCSGPTPDASLFQDALSVNTYVANQEIREQIISCSGGIISSQSQPGPTKQAFYSLASSVIQDQIAATPNDARIYMLAGSLFTSLGQYAKAETLLEKAHELSPNKQSIDLALATDYLNNASTTAALNLLEKAYKSAPNNTQVQPAYAIALVLSGKEAQAHVIFGNDPTIFNTQQMAQVYASLRQYDKAITIFKALVASSTDVNLSAQLAQLYYMSGQKYLSVNVLRDLEKVHPEIKDQIEAAIKQVQQ